jgi:serine/threonine protein kinase
MGNQCCSNTAEHQSEYVNNIEDNLQCRGGFERHETISLSEIPTAPQFELDSAGKDDIKSLFSELYFTGQELGPQVEIVSNNQGTRFVVKKFAIPADTDLSACQKTLHEQHKQISMLQNPYLLNVYRFEKDEDPLLGNVISMVMDLAEEGNLKQFWALNKGKGFLEELSGESKDQPEQLTFKMEVMRQILTAVVELHENNIFAFNIKLENLLVFHDYAGNIIVKLSDYGAVNELFE